MNGEKSRRDPDNHQELLNIPRIHPYMLILFYLGVMSSLLDLWHSEIPSSWYLLFRIVLYPAIIICGLPLFIAVTRAFKVIERRHETFVTAWPDLGNIAKRAFFPDKRYTTTFRVFYYVSFGFYVIVALYLFLRET